MDLDQIHQQWAEDCDIDPSNLTEEGRRTAKLHAKYYRIYTTEHQSKKKLDNELHKLLLLRTQYYEGTLPEEELKKYNWPPFQRRIIKTEIKDYLNADNYVIKMKLKIGEQDEKVELCEGILKMINNRGYLLRTMLDFEKFRMGA